MLIHKHHLESLERLLKGFESELIHVRVFGTQIINRITFVEENLYNDLKIFQGINAHIKQEDPALKQFLQLDTSWLQKHIPELIDSLLTLQKLCVCYLDDLRKLKHAREKGLLEIRHHGRFSVTTQLISVIERITSLSRKFATHIKQEEHHVQKEKRLLELRLEQERIIEHNIDSWLL
jgi:hypothetical protein